MLNNRLQVYVTFYNKCQKQTDDSLQSKKLIQFMDLARIKKVA